MARVPDLGSDFAQKMLLDLRRRRERLGFGSSASAATTQHRHHQRATTSRDACSISQKPLGNQRPQEAAPAPRSRSPETRTATPRSTQQPGNATATAGKPRRRRDASPVAVADARAIVPFEGEGGDRKTRHVVAGDAHVQQMAALALALSDGGKLRNMEIVARNGSVFFHQPDTPGHRRGGGAHASNMAIGVQDLNDMLMAAYSSGGGAGAGGRRRPDESGNRLFRGSMDMEEALSMLVMLQDASGYTERSAGSGKVLLLKGKENRESAVTSPARIVEIDDEESEDEQAKNASMQIVVHDKFIQSHHSPNSSSVMQSGPSDSRTSSVSEGEKDGSKVRMPSVIAKLMGLENLPSSSAKTVVERKGTERFVKTESVPRMEIRTNSMDRRLPIRIVASEKVLSNGQHTILLPGEWKNNLTNFGEPELSDRSSHPAIGHKKVRLTMREVLRKMAGAERDASQGVDERIIHEDKALTEEIKLQKTVSVGCRNDTGKKMDFLKRFRKSSENRPAREDKHITEDKSTSVGKKQATGMKRLLGRDSETKSRRAREKVNKENLATGKTKAAAPGKNGKADHMKRQAQSNKHIGRQTTTKKPQNCQETQSEALIQDLEDKKPLVQKKTEYTAVTQREDEEHAELNDISSSKPSDSTHGDSSFSEQLAIVVRGSSITEAASSDQPLQEITEGTSDPAIPAQTVVQASEHLKFLDRSAISEEHAEISGANSSKPSDSTHREVGFSEQLAIVVRGSSPTGEASQHLQKIIETTSDLTIDAQTAVQTSEDLKFMDQSAIAAINDGRTDHTASETTTTDSETFTGEEQQQQLQQQQQQVIVKDEPTDGSDHTTTAIDSTGSQEHATHVVLCDSFTENQLLLVRILAKDRYLLETAKGIVRVDDPVSFIGDDGADRNWSHKGNYDLLSDVAREVIRRKGKRAEAMEEVSLARTANPKLRCVADLVRELDGDVESLQEISKKPRNGAAEGLQRILGNDIHNDHPDANSTWDFSWNRVWELPIERNEVVRDLEKNILGGIITDVARDLIGVSVRHGCCPCVA